MVSLSTLYYIFICLNLAGPRGNFLENVCTAERLQHNIMCKKYVLYNLLEHYQLNITKMKKGWRRCTLPPIVDFFASTQISVSNPYLKILDLSKLFVADAPMKKIEKYSFTYLRSLIWVWKSPMQEKVRMYNYIVLDYIIVYYKQMIP